MKITEPCINCDGMGKTQTNVECPICGGDGIFAEYDLDDKDYNSIIHFMNNILERLEYTNDYTARKNIVRGELIGFYYNITNRGR